MRIQIVAPHADGNDSDDDNCERNQDSELFSVGATGRFAWLAGKQLSACFPYGRSIYGGPSDRSFSTGYHCRGKRLQSLHLFRRLRLGARGFRGRRGWFEYLHFPRGSFDRSRARLERRHCGFRRLGLGGAFRNFGHRLGHLAPRLRCLDFRLRHLIFGNFGFGNFGFGCCGFRSIGLGSVRLGHFHLPHAFRRGHSCPGFRFRCGCGEHPRLAPRQGRC